MSSEAVVYQFPRRREFVYAGGDRVPNVGDVLSRGGQDWEVVHVEIDENDRTTLELRRRARSIDPSTKLDSTRDASRTAVIHAGARAERVRADADARRADAEARRDRADAERAGFARRLEIGRSRSS